MSKLNELIVASYRTDRAADDLNSALMRDLGLNVRYGPARLAIAMSLSNERPVYPDEIPQGEKGKDIKGVQMFGQECPAMLVSLIVQHAGQSLTKQEFQAALSAHWSRGVQMLRQDYDAVDGDYDKMLSNLAERIGMPSGAQTFPNTLRHEKLPVKSMPQLGAINLHIGELTGAKQGQTVDWQINAPGHAPHIAVMGASGGGKTRLALEFAKTIQAQSGCPTLIFDMKGDIAANTSLCRKIGADVINSPDIPIPLDILHVADRSDNSTIQNTASRLCQSLTLVMRGRGGDVQTDRLRQVAVEVIRQRDNISIPDLRESLKEHYQENNIKDDSVVAALNRICDFKLFSPTHSPNDFFGRSWVFAMNKADEEIRRFAVLMILDALDRHLTVLPDAQVDAQNNCQITTLLVVDEAHKILNFRHSALSNIMRVSRSKGGVVILISQSPKDYVRDEVNYLENIGLVASYQSNASRADVQKVFAKDTSLTNLGRGECVIRLSGRHAQRVKVWE